MSQNVMSAARMQREVNRLALISVVVVLAIQIAGAVTLWRHISDAPVILGRYSRSYFAFVIAYHVIVIGWVVTTAFILISRAHVRSEGLSVAIQRLFAETLLPLFALVLIWAWALLFVRIADKEVGVELTVQLGIILAIIHTTLLWLATRYQDGVSAGLLEALARHLRSLSAVTPNLGFVVALGLTITFALPPLFYGLKVLFGEDSQYKFLSGASWSLLGVVILALVISRLPWQKVGTLITKIYLAVGVLLVLVALCFSLSSGLPEDMRHHLSDPADDSLEAVVAQKNLNNYPVYHYMFENLRGATLFTAYRDLSTINLRQDHAIRYSGILIQQTNYRDDLSECEAARLTTLSEGSVSADGYNYIFVIGDEQPDSLYLLQRYNRVFVVAPAYLPDLIPSPKATGGFTR